MCCAVNAQVEKVEETGVQAEWRPEDIIGPGRHGATREGSEAVRVMRTKADSTSSPDLTPAFSA